MTHRVEIIPVSDNPMEVFLFTPAGEGQRADSPGLVLCQHIPVGHTGLENDTVTLKTAERYAQNGYAVAVPFIFHWWPKSADIELKRAQFRDDWTRQDAIMRQIEIIGEASRNVSLEFQERHREIPWSPMIGMRNKIAHDYGTVDIQEIWRTATRDIPQLKQAMAKLIGE